MQKQEDEKLERRLHQVMERIQPEEEPHVSGDHAACLCC